MTTFSDLKTQVEVVEETYEMMLGYAAQGLEGDEGSKSGEQLRTFLENADRAIESLAETFRTVVATEKLEPQEPYLNFIEVLETDARTAGAAIRLVLAQKALSSQLIDNLNGSIHLRALLMNIFLIDEVIKLALRKK